MDFFDRILNLVRQTGERFVVVDRQQGVAFVVLSLEAYERQRIHRDRAVTDLTPDELLEKINHDVGEWREANPDTGGEALLSAEDNREDDEGSQGEEQFYFEPIE